MMITLNRQKHMLAVARRMAAEAVNNGVDPQEAWLLGYLHDIGYEFLDDSADPTRHAAAGGEMLRQQGYTHWREVYYHGVTQEEYESPELDLLNRIDLLTGPAGEKMSVVTRLADIVARHEANSEAVRESTKLARRLGLLPNQHS